MSYPKDASVSENVLRQAIAYHQAAGELDDTTRLEVPAYVRRVAGPVPPHQGEGAPAIGVIISWALIILAVVLAAACRLGVL